MHQNMVNDKALDGKKISGAFRAPKDAYWMGAVPKAVHVTNDQSEKAVRDTGENHFLEPLLGSRHGFVALWLFSFVWVVLLFGFVSVLFLFWFFVFRFLFSVFVLWSVTRTLDYVSVLFQFTFAATTASAPA